MSLYAKYEFTDNLNDTSGNGRHLTNFTSQPYTPGVIAFPYTFGIEDEASSAANLTGGVDYYGGTKAQCTDNTLFNVGTGDFSISVWMKYDGANRGVQTPLWKIYTVVFPASGGGYQIWVQGTGTMALRLRRAGVADCYASSGLLGDGEWHMYTWSIDRANTKWDYYLDTTKTVNQSDIAYTDGTPGLFGPTLNLDNTGYFILGVEPNEVYAPDTPPNDSRLWRYFFGGMDNLNFYTNTLTQTDVDNLYFQIALRSKIWHGATF